ncbi:hypothetical protein ALP79_200300 [Pseudomonas savastanoi pv. fraxini]|nr:hypothetical protein ALP79_200300 [Pseudomonas savastanoi pv. fraxini]
MFFQLLKRSLDQLPGFEIALFRLVLNRRMLKRVTFEDIRTDQKRRAVHGMYTRFGVIDDDPVRDHTALQPGEEVGAMIRGRVSRVLGSVCCWSCLKNGDVSLSLLGLTKPCRWFGWKRKGDLVVVSALRATLHWCSWSSRYWIGK